jgi:NAD(P)-dependent dehydrogenase (short-subunit alcohol dehydrogenase family)
LRGGRYVHGGGDRRDGSPELIVEIGGQSAIVTGGASGLGLATAAALAARGARVAILDISQDGAAKAARELAIPAFACDVTNTASLEAALSSAKDAVGTPRICVNCAGVGSAKRILGRDGSMPLEDFVRVVEINLIGTFNVMRLVAAEMASLAPLPTTERGVFINTASVAAYEGQVGQSAYAASKAGVAGLTLPAAREFARVAIRVLAIAPGIFLTPLLRTLPAAVQQSLAAAVPFPQRLGNPAEFAALALHMIENVMLNGEVVRIDGAIRLSPQ